MFSLSKIIKILFLSLFLLLPLIFTQSNSELFELPKAYFLYLITIIITTLHLINFLRQKIIFHQKTFFDLPLVLFLISQVISTIYSIDPHTSFYGYYSRLNGGLLSLICYSLLYWILVVYIDASFKEKIIKFSLISGLLVSSYAIAQHFGVDKNWWVQDVQSRVFSTFGQPNWLAAYLCILIPFSLHQFLNSSILIHKSYFLSLTSIFYLALLFTKSKSGIIACLISLFIYFLIYFFQKIKNKTFQSREVVRNFGPVGLFIFLIILTFTVNNPIKDSFISFIKTKHISPITIEDNIQPSKILITSSGNIRKIVWRGAIDLWKKFPLFGTGVETFAYSYYWTRPLEHNLTSEWDHLYNKAHNEYLNYLATTGLFGFITYSLLIISVLFFLIKNLIKNWKLEIGNLSLVVLSSYISILITNFAGFSVVATSLFFFILPAFLNQSSINKPLSKKNKSYLLIIPCLLFSFFLLRKVVLFYLADISYAQSEKYSSINNYQKALSFIETSHQFNPQEPLYTDKLSSIYSQIALNNQDQSIINQAIKYSDLTVSISPANINFWKQRAQNYLFLSTIDSDYFMESISALTKASFLAPTDAKIPYSIGQFLETASLSSEAISYYQKAIELKPNYDHAYFALGKIYLSQKQNDLAKENFQKTIDYSYPTNTEAEKLLLEIGN